MAEGKASHLNDSAGHSTNIGTSVPSDLSFVSDSAYRNPLEGTQQHFGDGGGQAGLACPRGPHKAQDGRPCISSLQAAYSQVLNDAILHLQDSARMAGVPDRVPQSCNKRLPASFAWEVCCMCMLLLKHLCKRKGYLQQ